MYEQREYLGSGMGWGSTARLNKEIRYTLWAPRRIWTDGQKESIMPLILVGDTLHSWSSVASSIETLSYVA